MEQRIVHAIRCLQARQSISQQAIIKFIAEKSHVTEQSVRGEIIEWIATAKIKKLIRRTTPGQPKGTQSSYVLADPGVDEDMDWDDLVPESTSDSSVDHEMEDPAQQQQQQQPSPPQPQQQQQEQEQQPPTHVYEATSGSSSSGSVVVVDLQSRPPHRK